MADIAKIRRAVRESRRRRIRQNVQGTEQRPRLCVRRSLKHIYAQLVDDEQGQALLQYSSLQSDIKSDSEKKTKVQISQLVGKKIGEMSKEKGISTVVFDRSGYLYHGRIKALADSAREAGLKF